MLTPFLAITMGIFWDKNYSNVLKNIRIDKLFYLALSIMLVFEIFYSYNNQLAYYPIGSDPWLSSKIRYENYNWGYNNLEDWFARETKGKMPELTFDVKYRFLEELRLKAIQRDLEKGLVPYPALFVYEGNFDAGARLWVLDRFHIYHAWPIISLQTYYDHLKENGKDYYSQIGFKEKYFILASNLSPSKESQPLMKNKLTDIENLRGDKVFKIYKF